MPTRDALYVVKKNDAPNDAQVIKFIHALDGTPEVAVYTY